MFGRKKRIPTREPFTSGWTSEMVRAVVGHWPPTRTLGPEFPPHHDLTLDLVGLGFALNKFDAQRMAWGWLIPLYGSDKIAPAFVRFLVFDSEYEASYRPYIPGTLEREPSVEGEPSSPNVRQRIGSAVLNAWRDGSGVKEPGTDEEEWNRPYLELTLQLTYDEWQLIRECFEMLRWRDGRGPNFSVRIEIDESLDLATIIEKPLTATFPITRFWCEAIVGLAPGLNDHPLFKRDLGYGGIGWL